MLECRYHVGLNNFLLSALFISFRCFGIADV